MIVERTRLDEVLLLTPRRFTDDRGWFCETWNRRDLALAGITVDFVQDNHSMSAAAGTLRGLHYQRPPQAQAKLVGCTRGVVFDVAVDVRAGSASYGQWVGVELSAENGRQLFIPAGFLHGFVTRAPDTEVQYKCSAYYAPECDGAVRWDSLGIDWGLTGAPVLSAKDAAAPAFDGWQSPFSMETPT
ncbi:MAG: dTDP-4-dehydrorhamnose 3,5-epimerase [Phaeovulum sp.]|uniref:dTDP-4-dehydrorhamnose 3,5-epimerase n=1 Tax=Phaeovulum sp. TaxID=2934796 RepID=UPI002733E049|nr:dTDP-4-dehydrorhamnose 3,5-epimerase [Phaeovulum sp.]MDP3861207.1 dTDP-4-dehydrorhamnose 3,5-epimerase [Phaeovulum sp.]